MKVRNPDITGPCRHLKFRVEMISDTSMECQVLGHGLMLRARPGPGKILILESFMSRFSNHAGLWLGAKRSAISCFARNRGAAATPMNQIMRSTRFTNGSCALIQALVAPRRVNGTSSALPLLSLAAHSRHS